MQDQLNDLNIEAGNIYLLIKNKKRDNFDKIIK